MYLRIQYTRFSILFQKVCCNNHQSHQERQNQRTPRLSPHRQNQRPRNLHERHRLLILLRAGRLTMAIEIFAINL